MLEMENISSSYKDPDGYIINYHDQLLRVITSSYQPHYDCFMNSGLYQNLMTSHKIVDHEEVADLTFSNAYKVLFPRRLSFISYPYGWCFDQLKDAALLTLDIQLEALNYGMTLKDASAFNVQFDKGKPIFIDTSSFEILDETRPWMAYGQFCRHFLAPLALMSYTDLRLSNLLKHYLDGIPLDLCSKLLPGKTKFNLGLLTHIHWHANAIKRQGSVSAEKRQLTLSFSKSKLIAIVTHLKSVIAGLSFPQQKTEWDDYYSHNNNYTDQTMQCKQDWIDKIITKLHGEIKTAWDIGANDGKFSRVLAGHDVNVIAMDIDPNAVNANYNKIKECEESNILPLCMDFANPSSNCGWNNNERQSIFDRPKPDLIMGLAVVHHLCIGLNVPLKMIAEMLSGGTQKYVIIEFVEEDDNQVQKLIQNKKKALETYSLELFKKSFSEYFRFIEEYQIPDSRRSLFLLETLT